MIATLGTYQIKKGLSEKQISQLINFSVSDDGLKYTSDAKRFQDRESFDEFSKDIIAYYTLSDDEENLVGIIWFHDLDLSSDKNYGISFAIRLYGEARGKGLAKEFAEKVIEDFKNSDEFKNHPHPKIWLAVSPENEKAVSLYRNLGFKDLEIDKENNKLLMLFEN